MALLELGGKRIPVPQGEVLLGSDPSCAIAVSAPGVLPRHAKLKGLADGQVVITKAVPEAEVLINGVRLGAEPTPLLHGDKVEVGGQELTFVDERRSGSTQYVQAMSVPQAVAQAKAGKATANTGGRVISLPDGRDYAISGASLVFGRDAICDVVVAGKDVSRRHAEIVQTPKGYLLVDSSTNGTSVNDVRVEGQRLLARADVITIGEEKFRFYADASPQPAASPAPPGNPSPGPAASAGREGTVRRGGHGLRADGRRRGHSQGWRDEDDGSADVAGRGSAGESRCTGKAGAAQSDAGKGATRQARAPGRETEDRATARCGAKEEG